MGASAIVKQSSSLLPDMALYHKFAASGKLHCGFGGTGGQDFCWRGAAAHWPLLEPPLFCAKLEIKGMTVKLSDL